MQLYFHEMGPADAPPMVILHGLFGSADNWLTVARPLSAHYVPDPATRQFLLKNLYRRDDDGPRFGWRLNLPVIARDIERVGEALPPGRRPDLPTLFVKGAESDYLRSDDWPAIQAIFPRAQLTTIANAGHWVQAQQPADFVARLLAFAAG